MTRPRARISDEIKRIRRNERKAQGLENEVGISSGAREGRSKRKSSLAMPPPLSHEDAEAKWRGWFARQEWTPFPFQENTWRAYLAGHSGLLSVPTGSGKTYAVFGGPFIEMMSTPVAVGESALQVIYVTPLKALARDIEKALERPMRELGWPFVVETRTGDTSSADRARQKLNLPHILITTPESLALLLTDREWRSRMKNVRSVIIDEWHELLESKRGSLLELTLARLRSAAPSARTWAVSATLGDLPLAARAATGADSPTVVDETRVEPVRVYSILPESLIGTPWFGRSGLEMLPEVLKQIDLRASTVIFTNTRTQAEVWYQNIRDQRPAWSETLALHHGSLDRGERERVEDGVKTGAIRLVVATSSLDLGVDFPQVEKVIQIGSAKSLVRATQRAGRAFHRPGLSTSLWLCPTHLLEVIEVSALREGLREGAVETRRPLAKPLDVFVQFILNCAYGEGTSRDELLALAQSTYSFRGIEAHEIDWALSFLTSGGFTLQAYPQFQKLVLSGDRYVFANPRLARLHRMNIGTIIGGEGVEVRFLRGGRLGRIDEAFVAKLKPGDTFQFAGRALKLVQFRDLTATVRLGHAKEIAAPVWSGNTLPISSSLSHFIRREVDRLAHRTDVPSDELSAMREVAELQRRRSTIPRADQLLVERWKSREGHHLFIYPWEGRIVHEGLGHLLAFRLSRAKANTISVSANDHGFELLGTEDFGDSQEIFEHLTSRRDLDHDVTSSLNFLELNKRAFREVARVAGLLQQGYPGERKALRQLQMSSGLLYDVFRRYEPEHPLLLQAEREVRDNQLQIERLATAMSRMSTMEMANVTLTAVSPFALPLYLERIRSRVSTESLEARVERIRRQMLEGRSWK